MSQIIGADIDIGDCGGNQRCGTSCGLRLDPADTISNLASIVCPNDRKG